MSQHFEYGTTRVRDLDVQTVRNARGQNVVKEVLIEGEPVKPSKRFWTSLHMRFGLNEGVFRYFSHAEVFQRISEVAPNDQIRWCVERAEYGVATLLAVNNPHSALIRHDDLMALLTRYGAEEVTYSNGIVRSTHSPRHGGTFAVAGDDFQNKYVIDTPIDGFGRPSIYLSLLRMVCTNGAVGYGKAFRSELNVGRADDGVQFALLRVLDGFNNEEGFAAFRQRFEAAARSWASVHEVTHLYKALIRMHHQGGLPEQRSIRPLGGDGAEALPEMYKGSPILRSFHQMTGDLTQIYGLANLDALSAKRQRTLPAACKVYELLNFASEVATHHASPAGNRTLQAFIGELVSAEYDLEGTVDQFSSWRDFFVANEATTSTLADLQRAGGRG